MIGISAEEPGIRDGMLEHLQDFLYTSFFKGVTLDYSEFQQCVIASAESAELVTRKSRMGSLERQQSRMVEAEPSSPATADQTANENATNSRGFRRNRIEAEPAPDTENATENRTAAATVSLGDLIQDLDP